MALIASIYMLRTCFTHRRLGYDQDCSHNWAVSEESLRRYLLHASERCIQELLAASMVDANNQDEEGWRPLKARRGVEIWQNFQGGSLVSVRGRKLLNQFPSFIPLANAIDTAKQWDPYFVEGQCLKSLQENVDIVRLVFGAKAGPLFKNREFIVYERREEMDDGTLVVAIASLPSEMAAGVLPESNHLIRGVLLQSGWVIDHKHAQQHTVTYMAQLDPLGWLPKWLVNILIVNLVLVIDDLQKVAKMIEQKTI